MKSISIYDYSDYKRYIKAWILSRPGKGRGEKRRIAETLSCNSAYVSQVLEREAQFSLEQAAVLNKYMDHNSLEKNFFLLLVQRERAGNKELREHINFQIKAVLERRLTIQHKMEHKEKLSVESLATYYSTWHYAAAHVLLLIPECRTREAISNRLKISLKKTSEILDFLVENGLARHEGSQFVFGHMQVFVPESSPLTAKNHVNWRLKAMSSLDQQQDEDLHYTSVACVNGDDVPKIRAVLMHALEEIRQIVKQSEKENTLICYDLDLFQS
jgi:uncharacterized protein (TIGR02147 family)